MHLQYCMRSAHELGIDIHAKTVMALLGITYQHATPQSFVDQWLFWNCENVFDNLPEYLTEFDADPIEYIGYGLTEKMALKIAFNNERTGKTMTRIVHFWECENCSLSIDFRQPELPGSDPRSEMNQDKNCPSCKAEMFFDSFEISELTPDDIAKMKI